MASAWLQARGKKLEEPLTTDTDPFATQSYDLAKGTNDDIDALEADKNRYFDSLISQYNHMFEVQEKIPGELVQLTESGGKVKKHVDKWLETEKEVQWFYGELEKAQEGDKATWSDPNVPPTDSDKRDLYLAARFDKDIAKDLEIDQQEKAIEVEVNDAAHMAKAEGNNEFAAQILRSGEANQEYWRETWNVLNDEDARYFPAAAAGLRVPMPGYTNVDGSQRYMTLQEAQTVGEKRYILGKIMANYLQSVTHLAGKRPGRHKRAVIIPLIKRYKARLKSEYEDIGKAQSEVQERLRAEELQTQLKERPDNFIHWMEKHKGAYNGSYRETRLHGARTIARAAETGGMGRDTVEDVLDHEFLAHDSTPEKPHMVKVRDYWKKESSIMLAGVGKFEKEEMTAEINRTKEAALGDFKTIKEGYDKKDILPTQDEKQKIQSQLMSTHGLSVEQLPDEFKNWAAQGDAEDKLLDYELTKRRNNGEALTADDMQFSDPFKRAEWLKKVTGGIDDAARKTYIEGKVDWITGNRLGQYGDRGTEWKAYFENATLEYNRAFLLAKENGATDAQAQTAARDAVMAGLKKDDSWRNYQGSYQNPDSVTNLGKARIAVGKDRTLIDSDKPWIGEEPNVEFAVKYLQGKSTSIPQYYRNFPNIKMQPIQLMKRRLTALGLLKDGEWVLPEEEIRSDLQNLFIKPSPARTYRVITDEDQGPDWMIKQYNDGSRDNDEIQQIMLEQIRRQAQQAQRYSTTDIAYRNIVEIPPELNEEFTAQVGELPVYLQLANLQPEVAKALVADTLMT